MGQTRSCSDCRFSRFPVLFDGDMRLLPVVLPQAKLHRKQDRSACHRARGTRSLDLDSEPFQLPNLPRYRSEHRFLCPPRWQAVWKHPAPLSPCPHLSAVFHKRRRNPNPRATSFRNTGNTSLRPPQTGFYHVPFSPYTQYERQRFYAPFKRHSFLLSQSMMCGWLTICRLERYFRVGAGNWLLLCPASLYNSNRL